MCQRCLALQAEANRTLARLRAVEQRHGGGIPVGHPDMVYLKTFSEVDGARKECFRRHYRETPNPTCIVCDRPATVFGENRGAIVCNEHFAESRKEGKQ